MAGKDAWETGVAPSRRLQKRGFRVESQQQNDELLDDRKTTKMYFVCIKIWEHVPREF